MFWGEGGFGQVDNPFVGLVYTCMYVVGGLGPGAGSGAGAGAVLVEGVGAMGVAGTID